MTMTEQQTRQFLLDSFEKNRQHSRDLFAMIPDAFYLERPIPLRHPIAFYDGHFAAFNINTLAKKGHGVAGIDEAYEQLFERGIDPEDEREAEEPRSRAGLPARRSPASEKPRTI
jgi:hypothetical protein